MAGGKACGTRRLRADRPLSSRLRKRARGGRRPVRQGQSPSGASLRRGHWQARQDRSPGRGDVARMGALLTRGSARPKQCVARTQRASYRPRCPGEGPHRRQESSQDPELSLLRKHNAQRLDQIERQIQAIETAILAAIEANADLASRFAILTTIPGVSAVTAFALLIAMPELGALDAARPQASPASRRSPDSQDVNGRHSFARSRRRPPSPLHASPRRSSLQSGHEGQIHTPHQHRKTRESRPDRYHAKPRRPRKRPPKSQSPMDAKNRLINTDTQAWHDDPGYAPLKQLRQTNVDTWRSSSSRGVSRTLGESACFGAAALLAYGP